MQNDAQGSSGQDGLSKRFAVYSYSHEGEFQGRVACRCISDMASTKPIWEPDAALAGCCLENCVFLRAFALQRHHILFSPVFDPFFFVFHQQLSLGV